MGKAISKAELEVVLKNEVLTKIVKKLLEKQINPAVLIAILSEAKFEETTTMTLYLDMQVRELFAKYCDLTQNTTEPSVGDYIRFLTKKLLDAGVNSELVLQVIKLRQVIDFEGNKKVLKKALRVFETFSVLVGMHNLGIKPELLLEELGTEYELLEIEKASETTPVLPNNRKTKISWNPDATEYHTILVAEYNLK